jgi:tripartite ATP-independent transporter DctP family solute receptor
MGLDRKALSFFAVGVLLGLLAATVGFAMLVRNDLGNSAGKTVLKLGHSLDQNHPVHKAITFMADRVREKSGGTVEVQVYPNGQLGSETESLEQLQRGALAMTKTSTAPLESFVPQMAIFGVPYVFRDEEHFWKTANGTIGDELLDSTSPHGLKALCFYDAGARSFYTISKAIKSPADLRGLKIRVQQSKTSMDMAQALGASPTPVDYGELYTALQSRMVDGAENNLPSFYFSRHFEVCKHYAMDEHTRVPDILLMSKKVWDQLAPEVQTWLQEAADESSQFQRDLWHKESDRVLAESEKAGVSVTYPDKQAFADRVGPMHESYQGSAVGDLLNRIKEVR